MKTKELMILIMSIVMAFGMMMFFSACTETDQQQDAEQEQATVAEEGESVEPDAAAPDEDAEATADAVNEYVNLAGEYLSTFFIRPIKEYFSFRGHYRFIGNLHLCAGLNVFQKGIVPS